MEFNIFIKVGLQIINGTGFACRLTQTGDNQMLENVIFDCIKAYKTKNLIKRIN